MQCPLLSSLSLGPPSAVIQPPPHNYHHREFIKTKENGEGGARDYIRLLGDGNGAGIDVVDLDLLGGVLVEVVLGPRRLGTVV